MNTGAEMVPEHEEQLHIMAIDCCEHTIALLRNTPSSRLTSIETRGNATNIKRHTEIDFVVIGVPSFPVRRPFICQIREAYPDVPMLILRRVEAKNGTEEIIRR